MLVVFAAETLNRLFKVIQGHKENLKYKLAVGLPDCCILNTGDFC